jgi:4-hydroxybenzoate polyprenyltransferase
MNLLYLFFCGSLFFTNIRCICSFKTIKTSNLHLSYKKTNIPQKTNIVLYSNKNGNIITKINSISRLVRSVNILPTLFLSFSGGWIVEPSIYTLLHSSQFITANIISLLIMSCSMILNDLFDVELDKINNPSRPLVNGEITESEAYIYTILLFCLTEYLSIVFLKSNMQEIVNIALYGVAIYTPIIKKVPFVKNIFCAFTVALSVYFSALSVHSNMLFDTINFQILSVVIRYIFYGSLAIELLLDISDMEGDKKNNINTLPVLIGREKTWNFIGILIFINILNVLSLSNINNLHFIMVNYANNVIILLFIPIILDMYNIKKSNFKKEVIDTTVKNTTIPMFIMLLYMCVLSNNNFGINLFLSN